MYVVNTAWDDDGSKAGATSEGIVIDGTNTAWDDDGGELFARKKRLVKDITQSCEILQLIERSDGSFSEHSPQFRHRGGLVIAQLAVVVGVPVGHADVFHLRVGEFDTCLWCGEVIEGGLGQELVEA